jgi:vancomycin permeability regulator SanA
MLLAIPAILILGIVFVIQWASGPYVFTSPKEIPSAPVAIVLGAGFGPNSQPSPILQGRLDGAIELFKLGKVSKLLMSGDDRSAYHNEPAVMRKYAVEHGIPAKSIVLDYAGRDTYDTCYRAKNVFGVGKAVVITQRYHAARAVYLAREMGIDAVGYGVPNLDAYPLNQLGYSGRECVADLKAWWDVNVSHRQPYVDSQKR